MNHKPLKAVALILVLLQLVALMTVGLNAATISDAENAVVTVYQTDASTMTIDGKISANEAWKNVDWQEGRAYNGNGMSFKVKTMWAKDGTNAYLYFLIDVTDSTIPEADFNWSTDSFRIFLDQEGTVADGASSTYYGWMCRNGKTWADYNGNTYKITEKSGGNGYTVESRIPFSADKAKNGTSMKLQILGQDGTKTDNQNNCQVAFSLSASAWKSGSTSPDKAIHYGTINLSDTMVKNTVDNTLIGSVAYVYQTDASKMTIDGTVGANEAWDDVDWNTDNFKIGSDSLNDSFKFKTMWAKNSGKAYLYVLIDVNDATKLAETTTDYNWANDSLKVLLDEDCSVAAGVKYEDGAVAADQRYNHTPIWAQRSAASFFAYGNKAGTYKVSEKSDGSGYVVEGSILLSNADYVEAGAKMRMNVLMQDGDNGTNNAQRLWSFNAADWSAGKNDQTYSNHAGTIVFSEKIAGTQNCVSAAGSQIKAGTVATSESTSIRIVSAIDGLDYQKVGYVVSLSNNAPVIGGTNVNNYETNIVYASVLADGMSVAADEGKYFFSAVINNIATADFDTLIYARAYVVTTEGTVIYDDTVALTVESLLSK